MARRGRPRVKRQPVVMATSDEPPRSRPEMQKKIDAVVAHVRKHFGKDSISRLSEAYETVIGTFPTGLPNLDVAIGVGGFPLAKLVQISGPESVGKSTLVKVLIAQAQQHGVVPYFIDGEMSQDTPERYAALGISPDTVAWSDCIYIEDAFAMAHSAIERLKQLDAPAIVFLDSIAAFQMKSEAERAFDEAGPRSPKAVFLSSKLGKLVQSTKGTKIGLVFVNQMRQKANASPWEDPNYEPGGFALRHWSHLILRMKRIGQLKRSQQAIGIKSRVTVRKSKIAPPFRIADVDILFDGTMRPSEGDSE